MRVLVVGFALTALALPACFPSDANLSEGGKGLPELTAELPSVIEPGSVATLSVTIANPGPGDMSSVFVSFSRVGASAEEQLPQPLIDVGIQQQSDSIVSIEPSPASISTDATVYRFEPLPEGESITLAFEVQAPDDEGVYANALVVYDGADVERARGIRIETTVSD